MQTSKSGSTDTPLKNFTKDILLRDGAMLRLRLLSPEDQQKMRDLFNRCSPDSIRFRFLHPIKELSDQQLDHLTSVDGTRHIALAVTQGEKAEERIVAIGRYQAQSDRPDVAEVSFLVEDALQRRGIGTQLLDTLAELARQHNLTRFAADVLTDNQLMLGVFRNAGYALSGNTSYGVTHVEFPIAANEVARARAEAQEAEAERVSLGYVLAPKSIAVIGASRNKKSVGGALFQNLLRFGFSGTIYPVNPKATAVCGVRAYTSISELPEPPELVFICVPFAGVLEAARQCASIGVRALCVISAGFAEMGEEGKAAQKELLGVCRASGMRLVGPNCLGIVNTAPETRMLGTFAPTDPPAGNISISSQSGALGLALLNQAGDFGLGVSSFVSIGNRADVSGNDLLQYWESDDATDVILLYLESFGNPRRFAPIARRVARRKPIIAVKAGRTSAGARAASSHTAALASSDRAADALFAQTGIIRVNTLTEFFSVARLLASQPVPTGNRIGIITNAGGPAILAADAAEAAGLKVPPLSEATQARLREALPNAASLMNPIDMIASAGPNEYRRCLEILCEETELDALLVIFIPPLVTPSSEVAQVISEVMSQREQFPKPVVAVFLDPQARLNAIQAGARSIPIYDFPENAVTALSAAVCYGTWRSAAPGNNPAITIDREAIDRVLSQNSSGWLPQDAVVDLLEAAGINAVRMRIAHTAAEAAQAAALIGQPMAMKVIEPAVLHKSDVGGVVLNVDPANAGEAFEQLRAKLAAHGITLAAAGLMPMAKPGVEVIAGITHDPVFGPLVAFGSGGVLIELLHDIVFRVLPLTDRDVRTMIEETKAYRLLQGYRGSARADLAALEQLLLRLGALAEAVPQIAETDLNPVLVHPAGEGVTLIDARIRLI